MKEKFVKWLMIAGAALALLVVFAFVVVTARYATLAVGTWAGVALILAVCAVALLVLIILKKELDA